MASLGTFNTPVYNKREYNARPTIVPGVPVIVPQEVASISISLGARPQTFARVFAEAARQSIQKQVE